MSSGVRLAAMPAMIGLGRVPSLKCASCRLIYSACWPARFGFAGLTLLPSAPWQAAQTVLTIFCALARSGLAPGASADAHGAPTTAQVATSTNTLLIPRAPVALPVEALLSDRLIRSTASRLARAGGPPRRVFY